MDKINNRFIDILKEHNYDLMFGDIKRNGFFMPKWKTITLSERLLECDSVNFAIAHELAHLISEHEELAALYTGSSIQRSKMEYEANSEAIKMLIDVYIEETGIEFEQLNYLKFMEYFNIPTTLIDCVEGVYKSFNYKNLEVNTYVV